jgi:hypothetical protein
MTTKSFAFTRGLDYPAIVATSEKVAWTVNEIFAARRFDGSKRIVPDSWVRTQHLAFLDEAAQRALNQIRAFSYVHLFGNYEEFIPIHLMSLAQQDWHADRPHLRALVRFGDEELKHQQLFLRTEAVLEESCGYAMGRYFAPDKVRLAAFTNAVLAYPPLPRALTLLALEWGSQRHYVDSVRDRTVESGDPLYVEVLKHHWIEENQHVKTGVLEIEQLASNMPPEELSHAFDDIQVIGRLVDETFVGQVEQEITTLQRVTGRVYTESERTALQATLHQSMITIWAEVAFTHPSFKQVALELSQEGAAKLGIV